MPRPRSLPFFFRLRRALWKALPVGKFQAIVHHAIEIATVVNDAGMKLVRHFRDRDEVAPPDLDRIDADDARCALDQLLDEESRLRPSGSTVGRQRSRVGQNRLRRGVNRRNIVNPGR